MPTYPQEFLQSPVGEIARSSCFVLMPFDRKFDGVYQAIVSACEDPEVLLSCSRADDVYGAGHIMEDVLKGIVNSEYVIADATGRNPNVFYELGISHCCKAASKVFIITQSMDDVPFDLRHLRAIEYKPDDQSLRKLRHTLAKALLAGAEDSYRFAVSENSVYKSIERLSGANRDYYTFELTEILIGPTDATFSIQLYRHSLGEGQQRLELEHYLIAVGESLEIKPTKASIRLDRIKTRRAYFSVLRPRRR